MELSASPCSVGVCRDRLAVFLKSKSITSLSSEVALISSRRSLSGTPESVGALNPPNERIKNLHKNTLKPEHIYFESSLLLFLEFLCRFSDRRIVGFGIPFPAGAAVLLKVSFLI